MYWLVHAGIPGPHQQNMAVVSSVEHIVRGGSIPLVVLCLFVCLAGD